MKRPSRKAYGDMSESQKERIRERNRLWRDKQIAKGVCYICTEPLAIRIIKQGNKIMSEEKLMQCFKHLTFQKIRTARYAAKGGADKTCILCHGNKKEVCSMCASK